MTLKKIIAGCFALMMLGMGQISGNSYARAEEFSERPRAEARQRRQPKMPGQQDWKREFYYGGRYFKLSRFDSLDENIPQTRIELSDKLKSFIDDRCDYFYCTTAPKDNDKFEAKVLEVASSLGYSVEKIKHIKPKEAITLSVNIVKKQMSYGDIRDYNDISSEDPTADELFYKKRGICSDYTTLTSLVFDILKKHNKGLDNAYVLVYETPDNEHAFNEILFIDNTRVQFSYIDATWADDGGRLDILEQRNIDMKFWAVNILNRLKECSMVEEEGKRLLAFSDLEERTEANRRIAETCSESGSEEDKRRAIAAYERILYENNRDKKISADSLYNIARLKFLLSDYYKAIDMAEEVMEKYPLDKDTKRSFEWVIINSHINLGRDALQRWEYSSAASYLLDAVEVAGDYRAWPAKELVFDIFMEYGKLRGRASDLESRASHLEEDNRDLRTAVYSIICSLAAAIVGAYYFSRKYNKEVQSKQKNARDELHAETAES